MAKDKKLLPALDLEMINPCCAAIDVGATMMMISYSDSDGGRHLLEAEAYTEDLERVVAQLRAAGVTSVAMEATGVYWIVIYELLENAGFTVTLVNARHFKNVDGKKTDVKDSQWLHQLHAYGLLRKSHIASEAFRELKSYMHERSILQQQKSDTLNRIHKLLTQMNLKVQHLISDIEGVSGMRMLRGIASGITDPEKLLELLDLTRLKAKGPDLLKSLAGLYRKQYVTILANHLKAFDFYKERMLVYEQSIEEVLKAMLAEDTGEAGREIGIKKTQVRKNQYSFNLKKYLLRITGIDLTAIPGLDEISVLEIIAITGLDMSKWKTAGHFTSWLGLAPDPKISGGKVIGYTRRFTNNRATRAFRLAAQSMWQQKGSLGQLYRKLAAQKGSKKANKAVARKLAVIFYSMVCGRTAYDPGRTQMNQELLEARRVAAIKKQAARYGFELAKIE